jgi:ABC-type Na+ transport system ATPase subunit NatA
VPAAVITAENLVKKYKDFAAVDGISLEAQPGEAFGLLGPNGSGKPTTMRIPHPTLFIAGGAHVGSLVVMFVPGWVWARRVAVRRLAK